MAKQTTKELIEAYVKLRDKKAEMKKKFTEETSELDRLMELIENNLLKFFEETGADNIKTPAGTAYKNTKVSATINDWDAFLKFVRAEKAWEFLNRACSKESVTAYKEAHGELPPGVNWREVQAVGFRRGKGE